MDLIPDRIFTLSERVAALEERVLNIAKQQDHICERVDEIYALVQRGKGAKWAIVTIVGIISGIIGILTHKALPW